MAYGLGTLRLPPDQFWSLTPRELAATIAPRIRAAAPGRSDLTALMRAHPDIPSEELP